MLRIHLALLIAAVAGPASAQIAPDKLQWGPAPAMFPKGGTMAVLSGNPEKPGFSTVRMRMPAGFTIPAHWHPMTEYVTVLSGEVHFGMGDKLDKAKGTKLGAGGFFQADAKMTHFVWTDGPAEVQVSAEGPLQMTYVNPADDPRNR